MKRDAEPISNAPGIGCVLSTATALPVRRCNRQQARVFNTAGRFGFARAHEQPDNFIALLMQQNSRCRTVYSTTHCQHNSLTHDFALLRCR